MSVACATPRYVRLRDSPEARRRFRRSNSSCICRSDPLRTDRRTLGTATLFSAASLLTGVPALADDGLQWAQADDRHDSMIALHGQTCVPRNGTLAEGMQSHRNAAYRILLSHCLVEVTIWFNAGGATSGHPGMKFFYQICATRTYSRSTTPSVGE